MVKQGLFAFLSFLLPLIASCGETQEFPALDDEMGAVVESYFNYQAWCGPDDTTQEGVSYPYEAYQAAEEEKYPKTYLKLETKQGEEWYCCTYTRWEAYYMEYKGSTHPEHLKQVAAGEISLPEITKPVFPETDWKTENIRSVEENLDYFCRRAFEEEYEAGELFEIYLTDFCPENGIPPMLYILCGDEICELRGGIGHGSDWLRADMELSFGPINADGLYDTVPKSEITEETLDHIREIAVLRSECQKEP